MDPPAKSTPPTPAPSFNHSNTTGAHLRLNTHPAVAGGALPQTGCGEGGRGSPAAPGEPGGQEMQTGASIEWLLSAWGLEVLHHPQGP